VHENVNVRRLLGVAGEGQISEVRALSDSEYEEYGKAVARLLRFSSDQQLFTIVRLNYGDFLRLLDHYFSEYTQNPQMDWSRVEMTVLNINRHLINFLSAVRMFLDHSETNLKELYGRDSEKARRFENACSDAYDNSFSYRFLYKLRNYAQHCGTPLGQVELGSKLVGTHPDVVQHLFAIRFSRDELLKRYKLWGKSLAEEIRNLPSKFDIVPHVKEMMKHLENINLTRFEDDLPELLQSAKFVQNLIIETKDKPGLPCILWFEEIIRTPDGKPERLNLSMQWLPTHLVDMIMHTCNANQR
jgi:hypothetical protein